MFEDKGNFEKSKNIGLSLIFSATEEYDTSKLIFEEPSKNHQDFTEAFVRFEESDKIKIHIQTISIINIVALSTPLTKLFLSILALNLLVPPMTRSRLFS